MGLATFLIGLVPTYQQVGISAAIILTLLRFLQGIGVGGEWGGSVLVAMEWARTAGHRGFIASWPQLGVPLGVLLANAMVLFSSRLSGEAFLSWGWRVPFWMSLALIGVGVYIRTRVLETPQFSVLVTGRRISQRPVLEVLRKHPREVLLSALVRVGEQAPSYVFGAFVYSYGTTVLGIPRDFLLRSQLAAAMIACIAIPFFGFLSDRIGRRRTYLIGIVATGLFGFAYFAMLETRSPALVGLALVASTFPTCIMYGPQAALIAETFPSRVRYSGASLGYHLAAVFAGGTAPLIAATLIARYHTGFSVAFYLLACAAASFVATLFLQDRTNQRIEEDNYGPSSGARVVSASHDRAT
jgi:MFS family permease